MGTRHGDLSPGSNANVPEALLFAICWFLKRDIFKANGQGKVSSWGPQPLGHRPVPPGGISLEIKCTINVMHSNHSGTILQPSPSTQTLLIFLETIFHETSMVPKRLETTGKG